MRFYPLDIASIEKYNAMRHLFVSGVFLARLPLLFGYGLPYGPAYGGFQSRPLGSSFAPIGVDATYDYVVSTLPPVTEPRRQDCSFGNLKLVDLFLIFYLLMVYTIR